MIGPESVFRYRLAVNQLSGNRLPIEEISTAARSGLQDGSPWSGLLALHCRVSGISSESWRDPGLAQVFGPRGAIYLVPRSDIAVFTLGVLPADPRRAELVYEHAAAVHRLLDGGTMSQGEIARRLPELGGSRPLRWAGTTGTLLPVWDTVDTVVTAAPPPSMGIAAARRELARRFFLYQGPASVADLQWWMATNRMAAADLIDELGPELQEMSFGRHRRYVSTATMEILEGSPAPRSMLLLPPEDTTINRRTARPHLDPVAAQRLWPKAPPPGALVVDGRVTGTWRRRGRHVTIRPWLPLTPEQVRSAIEIAASFPLVGGPPTTTIEQ